MAYKKLTDKKFLEIIDNAVKEFRGDATNLEKAIGMLTFGRHVGWKPLMLIHDKKTIRKYEGILAVELRDVLPEVGKLANKSVAWKIVQKVGGFWNAVKGLKTGIRSPGVDST